MYKSSKIMVSGWIIAAILVIVGLAAHMPTAGVPDLLASHGWFAANLFSAGVFSAGMFSAGIFSAGVFSVGIFSVGIFSVGLVSTGSFSLALLAFLYHRRQQNKR